MQPLAEASHTAHFALLSLLSSGRVRAHDAFEHEALAEHLGVYLGLARRLKAAGYRIDGVEVRLTDGALVRALAAHHGVDLDALKRPAAEAALGGALPRAAPALVRDERAPRPAWARLERVRDRLVPRLEGAWPEARFAYDLGRVRQATYYGGLAFHVFFDGPPGRLALADGGFVDWVGRMMNMRRERTLTSAIGAELFAKLYDG